MENAATRLASGDLSALESLRPEEAVLYADMVLPRLVGICQLESDAGIISRAFEHLAAIANADPRRLPVVVPLILEAMKASAFSHAWNDVKLAVAPKFFASTLLSTSRTHPRAVCGIAGIAVIDLYLALHVYSLRALSADGATVFQQTVMVRLDHTLSSMFRSLDPANQVAWAASFNRVTPNAEVATGVFNAMCGMLREIHLCRATEHSADITLAMLLWLPGMDECLNTLSPLSKCVATLAKKIPSAYWASAIPDTGSPDQPPFMKWWQVTYRCCYELKASQDMFAMIIATFRVTPLTSLERVISLWRSLFFYTQASVRDAFQREMSNWVSMLGSRDLSFRICMAFNIPYGGSEESSLNGRVLNALKAVHERKDALTTSGFAAISTRLCPLYIPSLMKGLPRGSDSLELYSALKGLAFSSTLSHSHPIMLFLAHEGLLHYLQLGGRCAERDADSAAALETFSTATLSDVPISPYNFVGASHDRGDDLAPINELLDRIEDIVRLSSDEDIRRVVRERLSRIAMR